MDNQTVCDKFQPTILEGQLCYTLDGALLKKNSTKSGQSNGLFLLLDPDPYHLNHKDNNTDDQNFKLVIHTLAPYTTYESGSYAMATLKKMIGTKNFKQLPDHQRKCLVQKKEECQTQRYLNQVKTECKCTPWALQTDKVGKKYFENKIFSIPQDSRECGPMKENCVKKQILKDKNCLVSCDGLYADISDGSLKKNMVKGWFIVVFFLVGWEMIFFFNTRFPGPATK